MVSWNGKVHYSAGSLFFFFLLTITSSGHLAKIRWSVCIAKSLRSLFISFSRTDSGLCIYHLFVWLNSNFLHNSQWITLPTQSRLVLYSFYANSQHSLIMRMTVSSLSPHYQHMLFCCILSILALTLIVLMALFYVAIRRDYVFPVLAMSKFSLVRYCLFVDWNIHTVVFLLFSGYLCSVDIWLVWLFLVAVISFPPRFLLWSSSCCIDASSLSWTLVSRVSPSFFDTYILSTSSLGCRAICIVISFLVLWSICLGFLWSTSRMAPSILWGRQPKYLSLLWDFCYVFFFFVLSCFFVLLKYSFLFFLSSLLLWWYRFPLFIISMIQFLCQSLSLYLY